MKHVPNQTHGGDLVTLHTTNPTSRQTEEIGRFFRRAIEHLREGWCQDVFVEELGDQVLVCGQAALNRARGVHPARWSGHLPQPILGAIREGLTAFDPEWSAMNQTYVSPTAHIFAKQCMMPAWNDDDYRTFDEMIELFDLIAEAAERGMTAENVLIERELGQMVDDAVRAEEAAPLPLRPTIIVVPARRKRGDREAPPLKPRDQRELIPA